MDRGDVTLLCMLDLSKCFDVIPHEALLSKLELYGVDTRWFGSYLANHFQKVYMSGEPVERPCFCTFVEPDRHISGIVARASAFFHLCE